MTTKAPKKASHEDWHPADVLAALHKAGWTLRGLAHEHGMTNSSSFSAAMVRSYPANEKRIADALGLHPKEIWPSRYFEDGTPRPRGLRALKSTRVTNGRNGNEKVAA